MNELLYKIICDSSLSQAELSRISGVSPQLICSFRRKRKGNRVSADVFARIALASGMSPEELGRTLAAHVEKCQKTQ